MSIAHVWPQAEPTASGSPEPDVGSAASEERDWSVLVLPDAISLVACLAPELSRLFGYRIGLKLLDSSETVEAGHSGAGLAGAGFVEAGLAEVGRLAVPASAGQSAGVFLLAVDRASLSRLLDRMFGARPEAGVPADSLAGLPPQSGSWLSLARLMGQGLARALQATGTILPQTLLPTGAFAPPARVAPAAGLPADGLKSSDRLLFRLDNDGADGLLLLRRVRPPAQNLAQNSESVNPVSVPADLATAHGRRESDGGSDGIASRNWGRRARDFALDLELPVRVQVGEIPLALHEIAALQPGDILPLSRPKSLSVMVSGHSFASFPAGAFAGERRGTDAADLAGELP